MLAPMPRNGVMLWMASPSNVMFRVGQAGTGTDVPDPHHRDRRGVSRKDQPMKVGMPVRDHPQDDLAKAIAVAFAQIGLARIGIASSRERPEDIVAGVVEEQAGVQSLGRVGAADLGVGGTFLAANHRPGRTCNRPFGADTLARPSRIDCGSQARVSSLSGTFPAIPTIPVSTRSACGRNWARTLELAPSAPTRMSTGRRTAIVEVRDNPATGRLLVPLELLVEMDHVLEPVEQNLSQRDPAHRAVARDRVAGGYTVKIDVQQLLQMLVDNADRPCSVPQLESKASNRWGGRHSWRARLP